jgi:hypothetical protein
VGALNERVLEFAISDRTSTSKSEAHLTPTKPTRHPTSPSSTMPSLFCLSLKLILFQFDHKQLQGHLLVLILFKLPPRRTAANQVRPVSERVRPSCKHHGTVDPRPFCPTTRLPRLFLLPPNGSLAVTVVMTATTAAALESFSLFRFEKHLCCCFSCPPDFLGAGRK